MLADPRVAPNRFSGVGAAPIDDFPGRETERTGLARSLRAPHDHLVIEGSPRNGLTSLLLAVRDDLAKADHPVVYVDLSSVTTVEDATTRIAAATSLALGKGWTETATVLARSLKLKFEIAEAHGMLVPVPTIEFRDAPAAQQRQRLIDLLDAIEALSASRGLHTSVIIDEFQEIERLGYGDDGAAPVSTMRMVRAAIQDHRHVTYAFAGTNPRLISTLHVTGDGALHNLGRRIELNAVPTEKLAPWLDQEFARMGMQAYVIGRLLIEIAGNRIRDVLTLAETCAELARADPVITGQMVEQALAIVVRQRRPRYEADWRRFTQLQQNVLRAVAAEGTNLTRSSVRRQYSLGESSRVSKTLLTLEDRDILLGDRAGYVFDDPFFRAWIITAVLPDVGVYLPITYRAARRR